MGLFDDAKKMLGKAKDQIDDLAEQHGDEIKSKLADVAKTVDEKTGGKHTDQITKGVAKAGEVVDKLAEPDAKP